MTLQEKKFQIWQKNKKNKKKNNRQLTKKCVKRQIALNDYNVFFWYISKSENTIGESVISK